jgi:putative transposase
MDTLAPRDHGERLALFRSEIIGGLTRRELNRGALREALERLSQERFRPPGAQSTRTYSVTTLERWLYRYKRGGLQALKPTGRSDRGRGRQLPAELRQLLLDIRREHRSASVPLILRTLLADGRLEKGTVSAQTLRRLYRESGLDRVAARDGAGPKTRLRWQAEKPGALWQGDVCHGPALYIGEVARPLRIHALMDDASRYVVALEAHHAERELDMLGLMVRAIRRHGPPDALFLDNGSTYVGEVLRVACGRLGLTLMHARPYDAQARGKIERFWRTLREGCLAHLGRQASLHDVNVRLWAFLDQHYHHAPHAGLLGRTPAAVYAASREEQPDGTDEKALFDALTVHVRRRVRRDTTVPVKGQDWELSLGFLAGRVVTIGYSLAEPDTAPWLEHEGKRYPLLAVNPVKNATRKRPPRRSQAEVDPEKQRNVAFDPATALLDRAAGRRPKKDGER